MLVFIVSQCKQLFQQRLTILWTGPIKNVIILHRLIMVSLRGVA